MEANGDTPAVERTVSDEPKGRDYPPRATLFTAFGIGSSYLFHVERGARGSTQKHWESIFKGDESWTFDQLKKYNKPLGETVTYRLRNHKSSAGMKDFRAARAEDLWRARVEKSQAARIEELRKVCREKLSAELDTDNIEAVFFTTGVAVLVLRLKPCEPDGAARFLDDLQDGKQLKEFRKLLVEIMWTCKKLYLRFMKAAEERTMEPAAGQEWSLIKFEDVDRENWEPKDRFSYPLFFVHGDDYEDRIGTILTQVAGSRRRRIQQSDAARVSYSGAEVYVDWSEALVKDTGENRKPIENNFVIAFASWFALILMDGNSSLFIFEAFVAMHTDRPQSDPEAVHRRSMAYINVSDASLSIRWTTMRKDLFLLETIHCNWSSERWRENIEERMKLLGLHYKRLEDESTERSGKRIAMVGILLTFVTVASAIADVIGLVNDKTRVYWFTFRRPLSDADIYLSLPFLLVGIVGLLCVGGYLLYSNRRALVKYLKPARLADSGRRDGLARGVSAGDR